MRRVLLLTIAVALAASAPAASQDVRHYHERTDGVMTITTPNGAVQIRNEHDASIVVESIAPDSLHAWYERLEIASTTPSGEVRPETTDALNQLFVLRIDDRGHLEALETPVFPASFEGVTDLSAQFYDFFPTHPHGCFTDGAHWADTIYGPPSEGSECVVESVKVTEYRVVETTERDGESVFVIEASAELNFVGEGPVPDQPGLRVRTSLSGPETNVFIVSAKDGILLDRQRSATLSGQMEYRGGPQPIVLPLSREYENRIQLVGR